MEGGWHQDARPGAVCRSQKPCCAEREGEESLPAGPRNLVEGLLLYGCFFSGLILILSFLWKSKILTLITRTCCSSPEICSEIKEWPLLGPDLTPLAYLLAAYREQAVLSRGFTSE